MVVYGLRWKNISDVFAGIAELYTGSSDVPEKAGDPDTCMRCIECSISVVLVLSSGTCISVTNPTAFSMLLFNFRNRHIQKKK